MPQAARLSYADTRSFRNDKGLSKSLYRQHAIRISCVPVNVCEALHSRGFKLYGDHFVPGSIPVALSGNSPQPAPLFPIGGDQPQMNSGSPTYPLDMFAALTPDRKYLTLAVVNATDAMQSFTLNAIGVRVAEPAAHWELTGPNRDAANRVGQEPQVEVKESQAEHTSGTTEVAPNSVNIYRWSVTQ